VQAEANLPSRGPPPNVIENSVSEVYIKSEQVTASEEENNYGCILLI
jgi:hypothetical protein